MARGAEARVNVGKHRRSSAARTGTGVDVTESAAERRTEIVDAAGLLMRTGVMSPTGHINFSARSDADTMLLSLTGAVAEIGPDVFVPVGLDSRVRAERLKPSIQEIVGMHACVYRIRLEVGSVLHTHSPNLTAFALAHAPLPGRYEALMRHGQSGTVPVVPWAPPGSDDSVRGITEALLHHPGTRAVLLANHGVLAFSGSPAETARLLIVLEEAAESELRAAALGGTQDFPPDCAASAQRTETNGHPYGHLGNGRG